MSSLVSSLASRLPHFGHFCELKSGVFPVSPPVGPNLLCKPMMPLGNGHYSATSPGWATYWSSLMRRRLLDWMCKMTLSWADRKGVCETWSPSRIAYRDTKMRRFRCSDRNQGELKSINYSTTNGKTGHKAYVLQRALFKKNSLQLLSLVSEHVYWPALSTPRAHSEPGKPLVSQSQCLS